MNHIEHLQWDSDFFNLKIGRVSNEDGWEVLLPYIEKFGKEYDLIYIFSKRKIDKHLGYNIKYVDQKVTYSKELHQVANVSSFTIEKIHIERFVNIFPKEGLYQLAHIAGQHSRYNPKVDSNFSQDNFERLYNKWIENSINGEVADCIFIYSNSRNQIKGFITVRIKQDAGTIGLIAVSPDTHSKGIGSALVQKVEDYLLENNVRFLHVATQQHNLQACNFYSKCNFQVLEKTYIYHYWQNKK